MTKGSNQYPPRASQAWAQRPSADRLLEFKMIVDLKSITQAARQLQQTRPTLSRRFNELESQLGVRLLQRSTRSLRLTLAGEELYARASRILDDIDAAWNSARLFAGRPSGPLRIGVPADEIAANPFFLEFAREYPEVDLDVLVVDRDVEVRRAGLDVALLFGRPRDPELTVKSLFENRRVAMATKAFFEEHGLPRDVQELENMRCIVYRDGQGEPETLWPVKGAEPVRVQPWLLTNGYRLMLNAVLQGLGVGLIPVEEGYGNPSLVEPFAGCIEKVEPFCIVYVERAFQLPHVRAFVDRAVDYGRRWIEPSL